MNVPQLPPEEPVFPSQLKDVRLSEGGAGGFAFRIRMLETPASAGKPSQRSSPRSSVRLRLDRQDAVGYVGYVVRHIGMG